MSTRFTTSFFLITVFLIIKSSAHMIAAQHGTLNIVEKGGFLALSLPASAFLFADKNQDSVLSKKEFDVYYPKIIKEIQKKIFLYRKEDEYPLRGVMLSFVPPHDKNEKTSNQILVLGRFVFKDIHDDATLKILLFGIHEQEKTFKIKATRKSKEQEHTFFLSPDQNESFLFLR